VNFVPLLAAILEKDKSAVHDRRVHFHYDYYCFFVAITSAAVTILSSSPIPKLPSEFFINRRRDTSVHAHVLFFSRIPQLCAIFLNANNPALPGASTLALARNAISDLAVRHSSPLAIEADVQDARKDATSRSYRDSRIKPGILILFLKLIVLI